MWSRWHYGVQLETWSCTILSLCESLCSSHKPRELEVICQKCSSMATFDLVKLGWSGKTWIKEQNHRPDPPLDGGSVGEGRAGSFPNENTAIHPPGYSWPVTWCPFCSMPPGPKFWHLSRFEQSPVPRTFMDIFKQRSGGPGASRIIMLCTAQPWFPLFPPWKSLKRNLINLRASDISWWRQSEVQISQWTVGHVSVLSSLEKVFSGNEGHLKSVSSS